MKVTAPTDESIRHAPNGVRGGFSVRIDAQGT